jgi:hypothetical protein
MENPTGREGLEAAHWLARSRPAPLEQLRCRSVVEPRFSVRCQSASRKASGGTDTARAAVNVCSRPRAGWQPNQP